MKITHIRQLDKNNLNLIGCMITYSGYVFDLMEPNSELINLNDIAHGLAFNCRWNGATKKFYSIAEHSIRVSKRQISLDYKLAALFHDSEEAYWGDIIRPLKIILEEKVPDIVDKMRELRKLIYHKYEIKNVSVKHADNLELIWDFEELIETSNYTPMNPYDAEYEWKKELVNLSKNFHLNGNNLTFKNIQ